jgi:uncharacterized membrane protein
MLLDRRTDGMTAVVTSFNAVLRNKPAMAVWIALILLGYWWASPPGSSG